MPLGRGFPLHPPFQAPVGAIQSHPCFGERHLGRPLGRAVDLLDLGLNPAEGIEVGGGLPQQSFQGFSPAGSPQRGGVASLPQTHQDIVEKKV